MHNQEGMIQLYVQQNVHF